jgi:hypothetical protein
MPKWFHEQSLVEEIVAKTLERIKPASETWDYMGIARSVYLSGALPHEVTRSLDRKAVTNFNAGINTLINCGCNGAKANLALAVKLFDTIGTVNAAIDGLGKLLNHSHIAFKQFVSTVVSK